MTILEIYGNQKVRYAKVKMSMIMVMITRIIHQCKSPNYLLCFQRGKPAGVVIHID